MVSPQNPLKMQTDLLADDLRYEMAQKALEGVEGVVASDYEFGLPKPSYTWNTLEMLGKECPDDEFVLLIGGDNWERFHLWHRAEEIQKKFSIVVYPRAGSTIDPQSLPPTVHIVHTPLINISSTMVRERIREGRSISRLVPKPVADIIRERGLYL